MILFRWLKPHLNQVFFILAAAILILGCGKSPEAEQQTDQVRRQVLSSRQIVYGSQAEPDTLNPLLSELLVSNEVGRLVFSALVYSDDKGSWQPDLAAEVPSIENGGLSPDGLTVTYRLRSGVKWHDGTPFTGQDVVYTWQAIMARRAAVQSATDGYAAISSVTAPSAGVVVVKFRERYPQFLSLFSVILPRHILANQSDWSKAGYNRAPVGTGPFMFKKWVVADNILFEANAAYYKGKPTMDSIMVKFIPDKNVLLAQLKDAKIQIVSNVAMNLLEHVKAIGDVQAIVSPSMVWEHIDFNVDNPLFADVRVRQALALAIDRNELNRQVWNQTAFPAISDQWPLSWALNTELKLPERDIARAKSLLAEAGWQPRPDGIMQKNGRPLSFSLLIIVGPKNRQQFAQALAGQWKDCGVLAQIREIEPDLFYQTMASRRFDAAMYAWVLGVDPDHTDLWHSRHIPAAANGYRGKNYAGWRDAEVDSLLLSSQAMTNREIRKQAYFSVQDIMTRDYPVIPLYFRPNLDVTIRQVVNFKPNPTPSGNTWNAWEWGFAK